MPNRTSFSEYSVCAEDSPVSIYVASKFIPLHTQIHQNPDAVPRLVEKSVLLKAENFSSSHSLSLVLSEFNEPLRAEEAFLAII